MSGKRSAGHVDDVEEMDTSFNSNAIVAEDPTLQSELNEENDITKNSGPSDAPTQSLQADELKEDPARSSGTIEWEFGDIEDPRTFDMKSERRCLSDPVIIRCLPWKILIVFSRPEVRSSMGMFLQCNAGCFQPTWTCYGRAKLELISKTNPTGKTFTIRHMFSAKENDWGYQSLIPYHELFNPENGYIVNKTLRARIHIEADAPHGADWDSKKFTGFVGLKNQGATCYLNSVLQALYFTNALRKAVFHMPTESDDIATSVPLALQHTFFNLQCSDVAVGTEKLTRSFGWTTWDSFMQHDAQELCRVLLDKIESKMKGTDVETIIPKLFCGKMVSYIRCKNVEYESKREEQFYDIQLKVKGNRGVIEAFKDYVQVETLDNENKYDAGKFGMQDAEKGIKFLRFPPVLYLQLMRFQYDFMSDTNVKINDRFEFPYELDLSDYLVQDTSPQEEPLYTKYFLQAVLVHSGDHHGGHYVVYINPCGDNKWYRFDDDVVCSCMPKDAIEMNYGSSDDPENRAFTNAYMLVYIACDARDEVLCPVNEDMIPFNLSSRFREERSLEEQKRRVKDNAHEFATINILLEEDFYGFEGPDLVRLDDIPLRSLRVRRQHADEKNLLEAIAGVLRWSPCDFQIRRVSQHKFPGALTFTRKMSTDLSSDSVVTLWAQRRDRSLLPAVNSASSVLCFFKYFDPCLGTFSYCGHTEISPPGATSSLSGLLNERIGQPPNTPLILYRLDLKQQLQQVHSTTFSSQIKSNDVIFFHVDTGRMGDMEELRQVLLNTPSVDVNMEDVTGANQDAGIHRHPVQMSAHLRKSAITGDMSPQYCKSPVSVEILDDYLESYTDLVDILLVDKLRKSDPGILIHISPELSYSAFASLVASYVSGRTDHLQLFTSVTSATAVSVATSVGANKGVTGGPQQDLHVTSANQSSLPNDTGNGTAYSPTGAISGASIISEQTRAARASGFIGAPANVISILATCAQRGLIREPPGPPIPSTTMGTLRDFLSLPTASPTINPHYTASNAVAQERLPFCVSRYSGQPQVTPSPFGNYSFHTPAPRRVYYAHTVPQVSELESLKQIHVAFFGSRPTDRLDLALSVPGNGTVMDLLAEVRSHVSLTGSGKLRLMEIRQNRITRIYDGNYHINALENALLTLSSDTSGNLRIGLRVEEIPPDEDNLEKGDLVINAAHFYGSANENFGVPFTVRVRNGELYSDVKKRIREKLDFVHDKEFDAWNFILVTKTRSISIPNDDDVTVSTDVFAKDPKALFIPWLGVEHKPPKRPRYTPCEKSIKIHN